MSKNIIFVYGSLRKGEYNNYLLNRSTQIARGLIRGFKLYSLGSYPFIFRTYDDKDTVVVEGYEADIKTIRDITLMELYAGYNVINVEIEGDNFKTRGNVFVMKEMRNHYGEVESGDWVMSRVNRYLSIMTE